MKIVIQLKVAGVQNGFLPVYLLVDGTCRESGRIGEHLGRPACRSHEYHPPVMPDQGTHQRTDDCSLSGAGVTLEKKRLPGSRIIHKNSQPVHGYRLSGGGFKRENRGNFLKKRVNHHSKKQKNVDLWINTDKSSIFAMRK
jgi:hypothetical protein